MEKNAIITMISEAEIKKYRTSKKYKPIFDDTHVTDLAAITRAEIYREKDKSLTSYYLLQSDKGPKIYNPYLDIITSVVLPEREVIRPVLHFKGKINTPKIMLDNGLIETTYGEYPQFAADILTQQELEVLYQNKKLEVTNKIYRIYKKDKFYTPSKLYGYNEYKYNGKKYVRIIANSSFLDSEETIVLTDNQVFNNQDIVWIEVSPLKWYQQENTLYSKYGLVANVPYYKYKKKSNLFKETNINSFLKKYMYPSIKTDEKILNKTV